MQRIAVAAAAAACVVAVTGVPPARVAAPAAAAGRVAYGTLRLPVVADTTVDSGRPTTAFGSAPALHVADVPGPAPDGSPRIRRIALLRFVVPRQLPGVDIGSARLELRPPAGTTAAALNAGGAGDGWTESGTTWQRRPALAAATTRGVARADGTVAFDVTAAAAGTGSRSVFVATGAGENRLPARESGAGAVLVVDLVHDPVDPLVGASVPRPGRKQSGDDVVQPVVAKFGGVDAVRIYCPRRPEPLDRRVGRFAGAVVVSFKEEELAALVSGTPFRDGRDPDSVYLSWFRSLPAGRPIYWVLWHEPENEVEEDRLFTVAQYVAAYRRLDRLADRAVGEAAARGERLDLRTTVVLMSYTLDPASGRDWRDWFPGEDVVDVLAWDVYNNDAFPDRYAGPAALLDRIVAIGASTGTAWGVAELGAVRLPSDPDDTGRARWLRSVYHYARDHRAQFVTYFDTDSGELIQGRPKDYTLDHPATVSAWADAVDGSA